jgi:hypothetical protein
MVNLRSPGRQKLAQIQMATHFASIKRGIGPVTPTDLSAPGAPRFLKKALNAFRAANQLTQWHFRQ